MTLKLVCESHQGWGTFIPNLGTLGLWVLKLFAVYVMDGHPMGGGIIRVQLINTFSNTM